MHQGNFFVDKEGRIVAVDFGIMGRLGRKERQFLAEILYGFIRRDYLRVAEVHFEAGYVPHTYRVEDFAQALRAIGEPIHSRTADQISMAKVLTLLFEITCLVRNDHQNRAGDAAENHGRRRRAWRESSTLSSTCGRPPNRSWALGSPNTSARLGASKTPVGSFRPLPPSSATRRAGWSKSPTNSRLELEADSEREIAKIVPELTLRVGFTFVLTGFLLALLVMAAYRWVL